MDSVFIERLWRSLIYECVYIYALKAGTELRAGLGNWIGQDKADRLHSALGWALPIEAVGETARSLIQG